MSIEALNWALNKKLPANQKLCLICVAAKAGVEGTRHWWIGKEFDIHVMTGLSEEAVRRAMDRLDQRFVLVDLGIDDEQIGTREYVLGVGN